MQNESQGIVAVGLHHIQRCQDIAHKDQPIRDGNIHISAPHIYGSVLEALELKNDAGLSFLNAGSGTGYLTCIAAAILGPRSVHYCVEIHEDVIRHSKKAIEAWKNFHSSTRMTSNIDFIHGNALELNTNEGECALGFDRIYIGAAIHKLNLHMFKKMLKPGGILVGPGENYTLLEGLVFILFKFVANKTTLIIECPYSWRRASKNCSKSE